MEISEDSGHIESLETNVLPMAVYDRILKVLDGQPLPSVAFQREMVLKEVFPNIPLPTIESIIQYHYQQKTKKNHFMLRNHGDTIYFKFLKGLESGKMNIASSLASSYQQAPYLISQLILQHHFAKHWESDHYKEMKNKAGQGMNKPINNDINVIVPKQLSFEQEFPSLKDTKQKRVAPTPVQNNTESNLNYSNTLGNKNMHFKMKTSPSAPLSLSDVMVIKTKKHKKSANKQANEKVQIDAMGETSSKIVENLILDKDKNKLFDRIRNKTNIKETILKESLTLKYSEGDSKNNNKYTEGDIKNNNVDVMEDGPILPSHLTPKKVKFSWRQKNMGQKHERSISEECDNQTKSEIKQDSEQCISSPNQEESSVTNISHVTPKRKQQCTDPNENRVTPKRIQTQSTSTKQPDKLLSSIHFMTQNCQSKDELYESYRQKLERLNERFTNELRLTKAPECDDKKKINKKVDCINNNPGYTAVPKPMTKVYLNTLEGEERRIAQILLTEKIKSVEREDNEEPKEFRMTPADLAEWKYLVISLQTEPLALFHAVSKFWARFPPKPKEIDGPKGYLKQMLRDPSLITDPILSIEITVCNALDDQYGPVIDLYRRSLGLAYEAKVMSHLTDCGIKFQSEKLCMTLNFDKTPDVLVYPPLWLNDRPVHWIESKALFGNPENHPVYEKNQYIPYYQRFGPGLVVYWFGLVDTIPHVTPEYMIVTNMPPKHLMNQPVTAGFNDPATFLDKFAHVISVSVENKSGRNEETGSKGSRPNPQVTGNQGPNPPPRVKGGLVMTPSKLTPEQVQSFAQPNRLTNGPLKRKSTEATIVCSTPLKNHIAMQRPLGTPEVIQRPLGTPEFQKPLGTPDSGVLCSPHHPIRDSCSTQEDLDSRDYGLTCKKHDSFSRSHDSFSKSHDSSRSHDVSSQFDISTVSNCSMCDSSLTEGNTSSTSHCTKTPVCFSSHCSGKLLAFTAPCMCSNKLLTDNDKSLTDYDKLNQLCSHNMERNK